MTILQTHILLKTLFGLDVGMEIGGVRFKLLSYPSPIMPIVRNHFTFVLLYVTFELNDEYWFWTQDISSRCQTITLIHGGLGHRPLLCEELVLFGFHRALFAIFVFLWEITHVWPLFAILANLSDHVPSTV